jgi:rubrerythrin
MNDEVTDILETAMLKEVASAAMYRQAVAMTDDPAAATLLRELAVEEEEHLALLKNMKPETFLESPVAKLRLADLRVADHLKAPDELPGADLTGSLLFAIKQEAESVTFYTDLMGVFSDAMAKKLCQALARQELAHKLQLELLYDRIVYIED